MSNKQKKPLRQTTVKESRRKTPTFSLELPLQVNAGPAKRMRGASGGRQAALQRGALGGATKAGQDAGRSGPGREALALLKPERVGPAV